MKCPKCKQLMTRLDRNIEEVPLGKGIEIIYLCETCEHYIKKRYYERIDISNRIIKTK